jgi:hypothetical protein
MRYYSLFAATSHNIILTEDWMIICCASELTPAQNGYLRLISDDFRCSSVFLKANNRFPACGEKCLKQGTPNSKPVMVIRCERTYNNKKRELPNSEELEDSRFIIVVIAREAGNDHD